jgi:hypothetical protein
MALALTGPLSLSQVNTELGRAADSTISLGEPNVRALAGIASGAIELGGLRGKSSQFTYTITSHQLQMNLRSAVLTAGWNGTSKVEVTVAAGIYIWSDSTAVPALNMGGAFPGGLTLINNGFIMGKGGDGGYQFADRITYSAPTSGGPAINLTGPITINNSTGYIGGGGGGGAGATGSPINILNSPVHSPGGGGAGGGRGGAMPYGDTSSRVMGAFGSGGAIGQFGLIATNSNNWAGATIPIHGGAGGASGAGAIQGSGI